MNLPMIEPVSEFTRQLCICLRAGINALVGSTLDSRASQATTSGLGSMVGKIQSGVVRVGIMSVLESIF